VCTAAVFHVALARSYQTLLSTLCHKTALPQKLMHKLERKAQRRAAGRAGGGGGSAGPGELGDADADWVGWVGGWVWERLRSYMKLMPAACATSQYIILYILRSWQHACSPLAVRVLICSDALQFPPHAAPTAWCRWLRRKSSGRRHT
jgi:hypothetical protein